MGRMRKEGFRTIWLETGCVGSKEMAKGNWQKIANPGWLGK